MKLRAFAGAAVFSLLFAGLSQGQAPASAAPRFLAADVHPSPPQRYPFFQQMPVYADHFILKGASLVDLIATAYGVDVLDVQGGPKWLEQDRFEIVGLTPPKTPKNDLKPMLQTLLAERFALVAHHGSKPMTAFVLSAGTGKPKMKAATDPDAPARCEYKPETVPAGVVANIFFECHNMTIAAFAEQIHDWAGDYLKLPVTDATGLKGGWDFDFKWTGRDQLAAAGADALPIFDAVDKELGLKLELATAPRPVMIVDSVNEQPTPNLPGLDKILPPVPRVGLEVATIKPSKPGSDLFFRITPDSMNLQHATIRQLMAVAFDLNRDDKEIPANAPKWLDQDSFDIVAKIAADAAGPPPLIPISDFRRLLRELLADRFELKTHTEELPTNGYKLVAVSPKMKAADPHSRTHCNRGPGPDGKDPSMANPIVSQVFTCQNVTMAQFAEQLQGIAAGYIFAPVLDATGVTGVWDFTLSFSSAQQLNAGTDPGAAGNPSTPNGALSLFDAVTRQLGLRLEKDRRNLPVLVIDHVDQKPTEN